MKAWVCLALWSPLALAAIYDKDDRRGVRDVTQWTTIHQVSAVALLAPRTQLRSLSGGAKRLNLHTFSQYQAGIGEPLCKEERFRSETMVQGSSGSGFLVAPQLMVTAGHVIESQEDCDKRAVIFGFWNPQHRGVFSPSQVYHCKKVLHTVNQGQRDFAVISLDRPVRVATPLSYRRNTDAPAAPFWMAGHPLGLSLKLSEDAPLLNDQDPTYFTALMDTYPGNSGSPVFGASGLVEGVLIEGEATDITLRGDYPEGCWYSKVYCSPNAPPSVQCDATEFDGAKVVRSNVWAPFVEAAKKASNF